MNIAGNMIISCPLCGSTHEVGLVEQDLLDSYGNHRAKGAFYYCSVTGKTFQTKAQSRMCQEKHLVTESCFRRYRIVNPKGIRR